MLGQRRLQALQRQVAGLAEPTREVVADLVLLAPVPVEVDQPLVDVQHPGRHEPAAQYAVGPALSPARPRRATRGNRREVDAHRPVSYASYCERGGQQHLLVALADGGRDPGGDVDVGRDEDAGRVRLAKQPDAGPGEAPVVRVLDRGEVEAHGAPSSRSETAVTSSSVGCQEKTPHGAPSTTGVSAPAMPRT